MKKVVIIIYCLVIVFVCIFVPWKVEIPGSYYSRGLTMSLSYSLIWLPPEKIAVVDFNRVVLEIVAITALSVFAFILVGIFRR